MAEVLFCIAVLGLGYVGFQTGHLGLAWMFLVAGLLVGYVFGTYEAGEKHAENFSMFCDKKAKGLYVCDYRDSEHTFDPGYAE